MAQSLLSGERMSQSNDRTPVPTVAKFVPIADVMTRDLVTARADTTTARIVELLRRKHVGCVPIVDDLGRPIGIVTKLDIVECMGDGRMTARELMMPFAFTLGASATVAQAAAMMSKEAMHHVLVVNDDRTLLGVVSTLDIARWLAQNDGLLERS
jgi:CBS domain-containing protein